MARIRTVKPEFFDDEELAAVSPDPPTSRACRLLFEGLWCQADKAGRLEDRPERLRARIFPYDRDVDAQTVESMLTLLADARGKFIIRYEAGGRRLIQIRTFLKNQHLNKKERASVLPGLPADNPAPAPSRAGACTAPAPSQHPTGRVRAPDKAGAGTVLAPSQHPMEGEGEGEWSTDPNGSVTPPPLTLDFGLPPPLRPEDLQTLWNAAPEDADVSRMQTLTPARRRHAAARIAEHSGRDWWGQYFARIWASDLLMGRIPRSVDHQTWRATFDWALLPDTIAKVCEGNFDNRGDRVDRGEEQHTGPPTLWDRVVERVEVRLNRHTVNTWFVPLRLLEERSDALVVEAPNQLFVDWLEKHYRTMLDEILREIETDLGIQFVVPAEAMTA